MHGHTRTFPDALHQKSTPRNGQIDLRFGDDLTGLKVVFYLVVVNLAFILLPVVIFGLEQVGILADIPRGWAHPGTDGSMAEVLNYMQAATCAVLLAMLALRSHSVVFVALAALYGFIVIDDALMYHERVGELLASGLNLPAFGGLRAQDMGELMAWAFAGALIVPLLVLAVIRARGVERRIGLIYLGLFAVLCLFGVGVDMLDSFFDNRFFMLLEDGGEMLSVAAACGFAILLWRNLKGTVATWRAPLSPPRPQPNLS